MGVGGPKTYRGEKRLQNVQGFKKLTQSLIRFMGRMTLQFNG